LRSDDVDVPTLAERVTGEVLDQLFAMGSLPEGYPQPGHIKLEPDPVTAGAQTMDCVPDPDLAGSEFDCIRLNEPGDFVRSQAITWESAAFFMYRIYIVPRGPFARVDPAKDFVALDVFLMEEVDLWETVDGAVRQAAVEAGGKPFRP
jgi:hypothetical protein